MERNIYGYKCKKCGEIHYPYRTRCKKCKDNDHNEFDIVPLPKTGRLLTYTHLYSPPADFELVYLALGIVELSNGIRMTAQLNIENPKIGMNVVGKVQAVRSDTYKKHFGMVFYKA